MSKGKIFTPFRCRLPVIFMSCILLVNFLTDQNARGRERARHALRDVDIDRGQPEQRAKAVHPQACSWEPGVLLLAALLVESAPPPHELTFPSTPRSP